MVAANAIAETEKVECDQKTSIGDGFFLLTILGVAGYWGSENRRRQVHHQLTETKRQAEHQEQFAQQKRIEDIGQLTGRVAHDFNNILQVIYQSEFLLESSLGEKLTEEHKDLLEKKGGAVSDAVKITRQLLTYARRQAISPKVELVFPRCFSLRRPYLIQLVI